MTVAENMGFGLRMARRPKAEIEAGVQRAAKILRLTDQLDKLPKQLSGGQRQRVAIGRAITRSPEVFLFDEPLSNLDAALRTQMRVELSTLHAQLGATMVYVTHDQVEAMTMASRIVVLNLSHEARSVANLPAGEALVGAAFRTGEVATLPGHECLILALA
ncbi:Maltose/maltodextrin import ATP-binding protein MalK [Devosia equisanguinis]|uniref:Maltose/maltodextrin import ATP-binding protein MalK n=1 Tax=Devosia equisanguinis TaxID=2490941 RepID=A0A447I7W9_9HYPH|nr:Maltose/maltodextrin import ATP-binding protein MalK [Devosia equisanguinis]